MLLSRILLAMLIAAVTTTISFAGAPAKEAPQQEQTDNADQTLSSEDEELAD